MRKASISTRLPLTVAFVILVTLGIMTVAAWRQVRRSALEAAAARLDELSGLLADELMRSTRQRHEALERFGARPPFVAMARSPETGPADSARALLEATLQNQPQRPAMQLRDAQGRTLLSAGRPLPAPDSQGLASLAEIGGRSAFTGAFLSVNDTIYYPTVAPVRDGDKLAGFLVEYRRQVATTDYVERLSQLLGSGSHLVVGTPGGVWTDLVTAVDGPPTASLDTTGVIRYQRNGEWVRARVRGVPGTAWNVVVEFPEALLLAGANRFLNWFVAVSLFLTVAALGVGWLFARGITRPLRNLTEATEAIARGERAPLVRTRTDNEVGRLAAAFATMAGRVEEARQDLEHRVEVRTAELEAANRELEAFSYSVSHDLRAPLRAISGFAQMLEQDHTTELSSPARAHLETIARNARQMGNLIDDLLTFSRLGRHPLAMQTVDMTMLARHTADTVLQDANATSVELRIDELPPATGEPKLLRQVWLNLMQNAVKFSRDRQPARIHIGYQDGADEAGYFIRDNGVGFDMRYADKLFGVFQRLHRPDEFEGTGVGLAIVQRVIHRHGGRVWAEAEPGQGATFHFQLPPRGAA